MKIPVMIMVLASLVSLYPVASISGHEEGEEVNVVIVRCAIEKDKPHRVYVLAASVNATSNKIPMTTRNEDCAQALHELLTAGFEVVDSNLEYLAFILTRRDYSPHKHQ